jgi:glycosyltransferase involved in cell wall biosynthesis
MEKALVSIGLPVFNGGPYLAKALDSLLAQSYPHTEIIISDNYSTDDTEAIARRYCAQFPRIRYSCNESSIGAALNWQRALELERGFSRLQLFAFKQGFEDRDLIGGTGHHAL